MEQQIIHRRPLIVSGVVGFCLPAFWGILSFLLFNLPEGLFSKVFWDLVYITCPFWRIEGEKALWLMSPLNALLYVGIYVAVQFLIAASSDAPGDNPTR